MSDEDLRVDYQALESSVRNLDRIRRNLEDFKNHTEQTAGLWGHHRIVDAMDEFSGNMDYNREKLVDEVTALGQMAEGTVQAFRDVETELASAFDEVSS